MKVVSREVFGLCSKTNPSPLWKTGKGRSGEVRPWEGLHGTMRKGSSFLLLASFFGFKQEHQNFLLVQKSLSCRICFVKTEKSWNERNFCRYGCPSKDKGSGGLLLICQLLFLIYSGRTFEYFSSLFYIQQQQQQ